MSYSILFVDDEQNILHSLRRGFFDSDYKTYFAISAEEGFKILEQQNIDMVVSDMRMPNIDGYEFCEKIKEQYPQIIRIILSGYSDKEKLLKTVSDGVVKAYLYKPWDINDCQTSIRIQH